MQNAEVIIGKEQNASANESEFKMSMIDRNRDQEKNKLCKYVQMKPLNKY